MMFVLTNIFVFLTMKQHFVTDIANEYSIFYYNNTPEKAYNHSFNPEDF